MPDPKTAIREFAVNYAAKYGGDNDKMKEGMGDWMDKIKEFFESVGPEATCFILMVVDQLIQKSDPSWDDMIWRFLKPMILKWLDVECD